MEALILFVIATGTISGGMNLQQELSSLLEERNQLNLKLNKIYSNLDEIECSNNGFYYEDINGCACFTCFTGTNCSILSPNCSIDDTHGNPKLFEYFWRYNTSLTTSNPIYYRSPYQYGNVMPYEYISNTSTTNLSNPYNGKLLPLLSYQIIQLHKLFNNIKNIDSKNIVIGHGATQLISATEWACKQINGSNHINQHIYVYAKPPYFADFGTDFVDIGINDLSFSSSNDLDSKNVIEWVTYPNNPDGSFNSPRYTNSLCTVYDNVYLWPSVTNYTIAQTPIDTKLSLFSMSKFTGHAGTRFGWALVDDINLAMKMDEFIHNIDTSVSIDSQYRVYKILQYILDNDGLIAKEFVNWVQKEMKQRWIQINDLFDENKQNRFKQYSMNGSNYAWVQCLYSDESDCVSVFVNGGITPENGAGFGYNSSFVRLELTTPYPVWDLFIQRIQKLIEK